jgi:hypothetical protein
VWPSRQVLSKFPLARIDIQFRDFKTSLVVSKRVAPRLTQHVAAELRARLARVKS